MNFDAEIKEGAIPSSTRKEFWNSPGIKTLQFSAKKILNAENADQSEHVGGGNAKKRKCRSDQQSLFAKL